MQHENRSRRHKQEDYWLLHFCIYTNTNKGLCNATLWILRNIGPVIYGRSHMQKTVSNFCGEPFLNKVEKLPSARNVGSAPSARPHHNNGFHKCFLLLLQRFARTQGKVSNNKNNEKD